MIDVYMRAITMAYTSRRTPLAEPELSPSYLDIATFEKYGSLAAAQPIISLRSGRSPD